MKTIFLFIAILPGMIMNSFSQTSVQKKQAEQKKASTKTPTAVINPVVKKDTLAKATTKTQPKTAAVNPVIRQKTTTKASTLPVKTLQSNTSQNMTIKVDSAKATLNNVYFSLETGLHVGKLFANSYNKDPDTHWSCGLFDQNENPITSFHDDNDNDEYAEMSTTGPLKMHMDNTATFGDFIDEGHIHINVAPKGNDTWGIGEYTLTLDFVNPKCEKKLTWYNITLSQDKRDVDLYFYYDGKNFVTRTY